MDFPSNQFGSQTEKELPDGATPSDGRGTVTLRLKLDNVTV